MMTTVEQTLAEPVIDVPSGARVVVAMSGGVDSSVTAALLAAQGYDVVGITLQLYDHGQAVNRPGTCCAGQDIHDARRVADAVGIPHYVMDMESRFKETVMDYFADTYLAGATPIPCVKCNETVKFTDLFGRARELGAAALVTGHYVKREAGPKMLRAADPLKDQSYFLFATTKDQLEFLHFPLGGLNKDETRALAERFNLPVASKPDSQDICFVPNGDYARVVEKLRPGALDAGDIVNEAGEVLGRHDGIINYTVGQRKGLGIAHSEPLYVVRLDAEKKQVVVGEKASVLRRTVSIADINWLGDGTGPTDGMAVQAKVRSTQPLKHAAIVLAPDGIDVVFDELESGVSPGQACALYDGERVLGGGWITGAR